MVERFLNIECIPVKFAELNETIKRQKKNIKRKKSETEKTSIVPIVHDSLRLLLYFIFHSNETRFVYWSLASYSVVC